ncbi:MAG: hypothetical protein R3C44_16400 [Chloroflexota bacterium]
MVDKVNGDVLDFYTTITGDSTGLGKLLEKVPGLSGYMERGRRRDADQLLRDTITARLNDVRLELGTVSHDLARDMAQAVEYAEDLGRADTQLMGLLSKIKDAPQGYAGFFDAIKVKEEDLARLYQFDELMLNYTDQISADVSALKKAVADEGDIRGTIRDLNNDLREANQTFNSRQEVLNKVK